MSWQLTCCVMCKIIPWSHDYSSYKCNIFLWALNHELINLNLCEMTPSTMSTEYWLCQGPLLLTWINFTYPFPNFKSVWERIYIAVISYTTHYIGCKHSYKLVFKLIHVSKRDPWCSTLHTYTLWQYNHSQSKPNKTMCTICGIYRQVSNISHTLVGNKIVDHSYVVGPSPAGAAPTTSSFST